MTTMQLRYLASVSNSNVDKLTAPDEEPVRLCNYVDVYKNDRITNDMNFMSASATQAEIAKFRLRAGDVLITKDSEDRNDIAVPAYVAETACDLVCGYHLSLLRARPNRVRGDFLFWALQSKQAREAFSNAAGGVTRFGLTLDGMKSVKLACPDLPTQKAIADFLDRETARIDRLIEKKEQLLKTLDQKWAAAVALTLTKGLGLEGTRKSSGISWLGDVPAHWTVTKLGHIGRSANGINISGEAFGSGYPFVSYSDVYRNPELPKTVSGLVQSTLVDRTRYCLKVGDVLFTRTSETIDEIGFSSVCMQDMPDAVFAGFLIRFRPKKGVLIPRFSKFLFRNEALRAFFAKEMMIVTRASLSQGLLQKMPLVLPPLEEQKQIAHHLMMMEGKHVSVSEKTATSIGHLREFRAALITAAVTGQIDVATWSKRGEPDRRLDAIQREMAS